MKANDKKRLRRQMMWAFALHSLIVFMLFLFALVGNFFLTYQIQGKDGIVRSNAPFRTALLGIVFIILWFIGTLVIAFYFFYKYNQLKEKDATKLLEANQLQNRILKRYVWVFVRNVLIYSLALGILSLAALWLKDQFTWYANDPLFSSLAFLRYIAPAVFIFAWLVGVFAIAFWQWRRSALDIVELVAGIKSLLTHPEQQITLSKNLKEVQPVLQQIQFNEAQSRYQAKEAEQRKNDLVVYLAHDLKTPLTSVIGYLSLLRDEPQISDETRRRYLSIATDKAERLEQLINEFFEITRFNLQNIELTYGTLNLSRMVEQVTDEFKPLLGEKNLKIETAIQKDVHIVADADKIDRVLDNLLRNAVNYSYTNGVVKVAVNAIEEGGVAIEVSNQGETIPQSKLDRIFE